MNDATAAEPGHQPRAACFGRFMIDLPLDAEVTGHRSEFMFGTIKSERVTFDAQEFAQSMERREVELRAGRDEMGDDFVRVRGAQSANARIFELSKKLLIATSHGFSAYKWDEGVLFSIRRSGFIPEKLEAVFSRLDSRLLAGLRARDPAEIPTEPGLCIKDGFIASDGSERARENSEIFLRFRRWPDVSLSVESSTIHKAEPSLLERIRNSEVPAEFRPFLGQIKTVREGRHDVGEITGEESLEMLPTDAGYKIHMFRWESHFALDDPFKPALVVELNTGRGQDGVEQRPTINEKDAVELFDAIVNSIHLRPTTPIAAPVPPKAELGTPLATGRVCSQSGVWQAEEGERRFLREGERMPSTRVAGKPSLLERLRGQQPVVSRATLWTLVAYEPDPADPASSAGDGSPA